MTEGLSFDKFMDQILIEEERSRQKRERQQNEAEDPRRRRLDRSTERANNRIRYVRQ